MSESFDADETLAIHITHPNAMRANDIISFCRRAS